MTSSWMYLLRYTITHTVTWSMLVLKAHWPEFAKHHRAFAAVVMINFRVNYFSVIIWGYHDIKALSAFLALREGNSSVTDSLHEGPVMQIRWICLSSPKHPVKHTQFFERLWYPYNSIMIMNLWWMMLVNKPMCMGSFQSLLWCPNLL